jgi:hypothetical protein
MSTRKTLQIGSNSLRTARAEHGRAAVAAAAPGNMIALAHLRSHVAGRAQGEAEGAQEARAAAAARVLVARGGGAELGQLTRPQPVRDGALGASAAAALAQAVRPLAVVVVVLSSGRRGGMRLGCDSGGRRASDDLEIDVRLIGDVTALAVAVTQLRSLDFCFLFPLFLLSPSLVAKSTPPLTQAFTFTFLTW